MKTVAVIGSGIVGTTIAVHLTAKGHMVNVYEKGPDYPYPYNEQFAREILYLYKDDPAYTLPIDIKRVLKRGDYKFDLNHEIIMHLGGAASRWSALTLRMSPNDFKTRSVYRYGDDWPITYDELEPYYCKAEKYLGVSGFPDNPFAPKRSQPYPMPGFEMSYENMLLAERLRTKHIVLPTVPQARTRHEYDNRPACVNFGTCRVYRIGARYSPAYHLNRAIETGLCKLYLNTSIQRILVDEKKVRGILCQVNQEKAVALSIALWFVAYVVAFSYSHLWGYAWYKSPPTIALALFATAGIYYFAGRIFESPASKKLVFCLFALFLMFPDIYNIFPLKAHEYGELPIERTRFLAAQWMRNHIPKDAVIATGGIGQVGYLTNNYILDFVPAVFTVASHEAF
jgi:hypothetical protein